MQQHLTTKTHLSKMFTQLQDSVQHGYQKITYIVGTITYYDW